MRRIYLTCLTGSLVAAGLATVWAQTPPTEQPKDGPPPPRQEQPARPERPPEKEGIPPVHVLPPFAADELDLTDEQFLQVRAIEKDAREKLSKILTAEQQQQLRALRHPPFPPPGHGRIRRGPPDHPDDHFRGDHPRGRFERGGPGDDREHARGRRHGPPDFDDGPPPRRRGPRDDFDGPPRRPDRERFESRDRRGPRDDGPPRRPERDRDEEDAE